MRVCLAGEIKYGGLQRSAALDLFRFEIEMRRAFGRLSDACGRPFRKNYRLGQCSLADAAMTDEHDISTNSGV